MALTMLRLLLLPVFIWILLSEPGGDEAIERGRRLAALAVFAVMALTDQLDGYLARRLNQTSRIGSILDPLADKMLVASSVVLLSFPRLAGADWRIPLEVVAAVYLKDLLVVVGIMILVRRFGRIEIRPRMLGKVSTVVQLALVIYTLLAPDVALLSFATARGILISMHWVVIAVAAAACVDYYLVGARRYAELRAKENEA